MMEPTEMKWVVYIDDVHARDVMRVSVVWALFVLLNSVKIRTKRGEREFGQAQCRR